MIPPPNPERESAGPAMAADDEKLRLIWNERRKLEATFVNNVGVTVIATGVITPLLAHLYGLTTASSLSWLTNAGLVLLCLMAGIGLNWFAVSWLKGLE